MAPKLEGSLIYPLALIYTTAVIFRSIPTMIVGGIPFWDPYVYLDLIHSNPTFVDVSGYFPYYHLYVVFFYKATQIDPLFFIRFLPAFTDSLTVIVMYYVAEFLWGSERAGMRAALLFAVTDIAVLRQSYAISEGFSLIFYAGLWLGMMGFVRRPERRYLILFFFMLYVLGGTHGLPLGLFFPTTVLACLLEGLQNRQLNVLAAASTIVFAFWLTQIYYSNFVLDYILSFHQLVTSQVVAATSNVAGQYIVAPKSREQFIAEHSSTLIIASLAAICAIDLAFQVKNRRRLTIDPAKTVILSTAIVTSLFLGANTLMDMKSVVGGYASAYRAWLPLAQVIILLASKPLSTVENIHPMYGKLILILIYVSSAVSTLLFIENYVVSFPHLR